MAAEANIVGRALTIATAHVRCLPLMARSRRHSSRSCAISALLLTRDAGWFAAIALGYLVVINAVANGCRLAPRDTTAATVAVDWPAEPGECDRGRRGPQRQCAPASPRRAAG